MADRLVALNRGGAVTATVVVAVAFWAQADLSGFERRTAVDAAFSSVFVTFIVASPFILAFLFAPALHDQRWAGWLIAAVIIGSATWMAWLAREPIPPQGRDGIIFLVVAVIQCIVVGAVRAASDLGRRRTRRSNASAG